MTSLATRPPAAAFKQLLHSLHELVAHYVTIHGKPLRFMEVCGTHTQNFFRTGLAGLLPEALVHVSGPGCPVCVTPDEELHILHALSLLPGVRLAVFGDMVRVPDSRGQSLRTCQAMGGRVHSIYSPLEILDLAQNFPDDLIVYGAFGFETTAPLSAACILQAAHKRVENIGLFSCHKLIPPVLDALLHEEQGSQHALDGLLLPGHALMVSGLGAYGFLPEKYHISGVAGGFEAHEILLALYLLVRSALQGKAELLNAYEHVVSMQGSSTAQTLCAQVFEPCDALWRGLGPIAGSGLRLSPAYRHFDALSKLEQRGLSIAPSPQAPKNNACCCSEVLRGRLSPPQCPLFGTSCQPANPVGVCMASSEGSCSAWYTYKQ